MVVGHPAAMPPEPDADGEGDPSEMSGALRSRSARGLADDSQIPFTEIEVGDPIVQQKLDQPEEPVDEGRLFTQGTKTGTLLSDQDHR